MTDADLLAALDFDADPKCQAVDHDKGTGGCEADRPAEFIVEAYVCGGPGRHSFGRWRRFPACRGYAGLLRTATNTTMKSSPGGRVKLNFP